MPGWDHPDATASKACGAAWLRSGRSLLLFVPSVVARVASNILINPNHAEFGMTACSLHLPVWWDARLFPAPDESAAASAVPSRP